MSSSTSSACDRCRRNKQRCSGTQPCSRCERSGTACTYGHAAGRTTTRDYTSHLENKIAELQALLDQRPEAGSSSQQRTSPAESDAATRDRLIDTFIRPEDDYIYVPPQRPSMAYYGRYGGLSALRKVRDLCYDVADPELLPVDADGADMAEAFDSSLLDMPHSNDLAALALLPSQERLQRTIGTALDLALVCKECLDRYELMADIDELYRRDPEDHRDQDRSLLALVYALLALGRRYEPPNTADIQVPASDRVILQGLSYFRASKAIVDSMGYADLNTVRASICLSMFLLSSSMTSKAYSTICVGASAALRLGLHVSGATFRQRLSAHELTQRRRTFAVLHMMTLIISSILGMPNILRNSDADQCIPVPEQHMADEGLAFVLADPFSPVAETIISARIYRILSRIIEARSGAFDIHATSETVYEVDRSEIASLASELETVHQQFLLALPEITDQRALLAQLYLRMQHSGVQLILHRPFLAHLGRNKQDPSFNYDGYAFGSTALQAATQLVWIIDALDNYGLLHEAQWYVFML